MYIYMHYTGSPSFLGPALGFDLESLDYGPRAWALSFFKWIRSMDSCFEMAPASRIPNPLINPDPGFHRP